MPGAIATTPLHSRCLIILAGLCLALAPAAVLAQTASPVAAGPVIEVDCGAGDSLAGALAEHGSGTTFRISGTCLERVTITEDDITIDGGGSAVLDAADDAEGAVIHVVGARNVTVRDITVQNGNWGILVEELSTIELDGVEALGNVTHGVEVIHSHIIATELISHDNGRVGLIVDRNSELRLFDSTLEANGISGLVVFSSAIARLEGTNVIRGNDAQGITLGMGGKIFTIAAELIIEENGAQGLSLLQGGEGQFLGGTLTVRGNAADGIALDLDSTLILGIAEFGVPGEVLVEENGGHGISLTRDAQLVLDPTMPATVRANAGSGLFVDASDITVTGAIIADNGGPQLELDFGARATVEETTLDDVVCGEAVLLRGSASCP